MGCVKLESFRGPTAEAASDVSTGPHAALEARRVAELSMAASRSRTTTGISPARTTPVATALWLLSTMASACATPHGVESWGQRHTVIRLDLIPFNEPVALFLRVSESGLAEAVRYQPALMAVTEVARATLHDQDLKRVLSAVSQPQMQRALRGEIYGGGGLTQGDQFHLVIEAEADGAGECGGFLLDAPGAVRDLVAEMVRLASRLEKAPRADAYLRSLPIPNERLRSLEREGRVRFYSIEELPEDVRAKVSAAVAAPRDFHEIGQAQYEELLRWCTHGHELFVTSEGAGNQVTLFR